MGAVAVQCVKQRLAEATSHTQAIFPGTDEIWELGNKYLPPEFFLEIDRELAHAVRAETPRDLHEPFAIQTDSTIGYYTSVLRNPGALPHEQEAGIRYVVGAAVRRQPLPYLLIVHWMKPPTESAAELLKSQDGKLAVLQSLRGWREQSLLKRAPGPRGDILGIGRESGKGKVFLGGLSSQLAKITGEVRNEVALALGEWGGEREVQFLSDELSRELTKSDIAYQANLISALTTVGGPAAIEALLNALSAGSDRVKVIALSGIESLTTAGAVALTERSDPPTIDTEEREAAYSRLIERLESAHRAEVSEYVYHKISDLLEVLEAGLPAR